MTRHIAAGPVTIEFRPVPRLKLPLAGLGAVFTNLCTAAGHIFELKYVLPYEPRLLSEA